MALINKIGNSSNNTRSIVMRFLLALNILGLICFLGNVRADTPTTKSARAKLETPRYGFCRDDRDCGAGSGQACVFDRCRPKLRVFGKGFAGKQFHCLHADHREPIWIKDGYTATEDDEFVCEDPDTIYLVVPTGVDPHNCSGELFMDRLMEVHKIFERGALSESIGCQR